MNTKTQTKRHQRTPEQQAAIDAERAYNEKVRQAVEHVSLLLKQAGLPKHLVCYESFGLDIFNPSRSSPTVGTVECRRMIDGYENGHYSRVSAFELPPSREKIKDREAYKAAHSEWKLRWHAWTKTEISKAAEVLTASGIPFRQFEDYGQSKLRLIL